MLLNNFLIQICYKSKNNQRTCLLLSSYNQKTKQLQIDYRITYIIINQLFKF